MFAPFKKKPIATTNFNYGFTCVTRKPSTSSNDFITFQVVNNMLKEDSLFCNESVEPL